MIVEKLSVSGFRKFAQHFDFLPDPRFTVIHAPNGTGKSTLLDALYFGLLERHSVTGKDAELRFRSLGREITPTIEVDFAVGGARYRLRKVFLGKTKSASLSRLEAGRYVPLKDSGAADDFVRDLLFAEAPGRGAINAAEHLGFAHVLWAPARASFGDLPTSAGDQIRAMLGGASLAVTEGERNVQQRATAEYKHFFKDEGGYTTRAGSADVPSLEAKTAAAREAEIEARRHYLQLEQLTVAYDDREAEAKRMRAVRGDLRNDIESAKAAVAAYNDLKRAADLAAGAEAEARTAHEQVTSRIDSLAALRAQRRQLQAEQSKCADDVAELDVAVTSSNERFSRARTVFEDASATSASIQRRSTDVTMAHTYVESRTTARRIKTILASHEKSALTLAELCASQSAIAAPTRADLETLRDAAAQVEALEAAIATSALSLEIDAQRDVTLDVIAGETTGALTLAAGSTGRIAAANDTLVVDVPGVGRIRVRGTDSAAKARTKLQALKARLDAARERYGTHAIAELAARTERYDELKAAIQQTREAMTALLEGAPIDDLRESLAGANARIASIEATHPEWQADPPDAVAVRAAFDRDLQHAADAFALANIERAAAEQSKTEIDTALAALKALRASLDVNIETNAAHIQTLEADGLDDAARIENVQRLALSWNAARAEQRKLNEELARFLEDPQTLLARLEAAERGAGEGYEDALVAAKQLRVKLDMQATLGGYAKLVAAEEHTAHCEAELAAATSQARAIACLSGAFARISAARLASVIGPVSAASTRYYTRIAGSPMGKIDIGEGLSPTGLIDAASGRPLLVDGTLSTGEKEQVYLAVRLALAEVIAKDRGRQLFVVDDAATATDPNRLRRFVGILEELSREHLQVIVTTADPSRYLGISGAKHIDLSAALLTENAA